MQTRIAVFLSQIMAEFQIEIVNAIVETTRELGYGFDLFTAFGAYGENYMHAEGERNIINLPYMEDYAGVILVPDTFAVSEMEKQLDILLLAKMQGPVVSIRQEKDCFYNIQIDNRAAMSMIVEHFVKKHGLKKICFMKGRNDLKDAQERYLGYLDVMNRYGIEVTEHMVFQGDYWRNKGPQAVKWFMEDEEKPEAIVCANDFMAISVIQELVSKGIKVPQDIAVSGFDDLEESRYIDPSLYTAHMPCGAMAREAVRLIDRVLKGEKCDQITFLPIELRERGSCGCVQEEKGRWTQELFREKIYLNHVITQNVYMNIDYENCDTIDELLTIAFNYSKQFYFTKLYICMCEKPEEHEDGRDDLNVYSEYMVLRAVMDKKEGLMLMQERFLRRDLLPDCYRERNDQFYFFPLHHNNRCLGYMVLETDDPGQFREFIQPWIIEFASCMDRILLYEENQNLREFRRLSTVDELTGLYNRRKLDQELSKRLVMRGRKKLSFYIVSLDMDGLKTINDTYGHIEGDAALKAYAEILRGSVNENDLCCRVGGDEFMIVAYCESEAELQRVLQRIEKAVAEFNQSGNKPYKLSGSMGYAELMGNEEIMNCIKRADINMYAEKVAKKKGRK